MGELSKVELSPWSEKDNSDDDNEYDEIKYRQTEQKIITL